MKKPSPTQGRGVNVFAVPPWFVATSRYQPLQVLPGYATQDGSAMTTTLWLITKAIRLSLLTPDRAFNLQLRGHFQCWHGADFSSPSTRCSHPLHLLVLFNVVLYLICKVLNLWYATNKKTPVLRGCATSLIPLILRTVPPELAPCTLRRSGLPGFIGPYPSTSLDESSCYCKKLFTC
jgi:hypothetical protein